MDHSPLSYPSVWKQWWGLAEASPGLLGDRQKNSFSVFIICIPVISIPVPQFHCSVIWEGKEIVLKRIWDWLQDSCSQTVSSTRPIRGGGKRQSVEHSCNLNISCWQMVSDPRGSPECKASITLAHFPFHLLAKQRLPKTSGTFSEVSSTATHIREQTCAMVEWERGMDDEGSIVCHMHLKEGYEFHVSLARFSFSPNTCSSHGTEFLTLKSSGVSPVTPQKNTKTRFPS